MSESSLKELIAAHSVEIKNLEDEAANLQTTSFSLRQKREELIAQMILEEKLLSDTDWDLSVGGGSGDAVLSYKETSPNTLEFIKELARTDYHSWFEIQDGIQLRFDDSDISLSFKESKQLMPFAKRNGLRISGAGIKDRLAKLKRDVVALETICHQFNLDK
jgi:hypothetical protein